jgi:hypothetical protein
MGFELEYRINGRKGKEAWLRHIKEKAQTGTLSELEEGIARRRCPVHAEAPARSAISACRPRRARLGITGRITNLKSRW